MNNNSYINKTSLIREICDVNQPIPKSKTSKKKVVNNCKDDFDVSHCYAQFL